MRYARKRPTNKRKRYNRRNRLYRPIKRYSKSGLNKVYYFTRYANDVGAPLIAANNNVPFANSLYFQLVDVAAHTDFTTLFDMYKIKAVKVTFTPQMTQNVSTTTFNNPYASARFYSAIDYNDSTVISSADEIREYKSCKWTSILKPHVRYIKRPQIQDRGGTYSAGSPWINCTAPTQAYYGLKIFLESTDATNTADLIFSTQIKFYLAFKNVK